MKLDIACGSVKPEGWVGIDIADLPCVDIRHDLTRFPWPVADESVDEAQCNHYFEHVPRLDRPRFMSELWRVLRPGAGCVIVTPLGLWRQFQDFSHTWPVVPASFQYFNREWLREWNLTHYIDVYGIACDFAIVDQHILMDPAYESLSPEDQYGRAMTEMNAAIDLRTVVKKRPL